MRNISHLIFKALLCFVVMAVSQTQQTRQSGCQFEDANHIFTINMNSAGTCSKGSTTGETDLREEVESLKTRVQAIEEAAVRGRARLANSTRVHSSCSSWMAAGLNTTSYVMVDPDGDGGVQPFLAYCNVTRAGDRRPVPTEIHHDIMGKNKINSKCAPAKCFTQIVHYMASKAQIEAFIAASNNCHQFIRYDCYRSVLFHTGNHYGAWFDRDGREMSYWGGARGPNNCACGESNSCAQRGKRCNCDKNDGVWRADYGYLSDKSTLPVSMMKFGDLDGSTEMAYFTLGPLICY